MEIKITPMSDALKQGYEPMGDADAELDRLPIPPRPVTGARLRLAGNVAVYDQVPEAITTQATGGYVSTKDSYEPLPTPGDEF